jgi:pantoate--beta-alanine ligase
VIERIASKGEVRSAIAAARREGKTVGLVPTMGALHEGHLSLVQAACKRTDIVMVSIFVNPTQFAPGEDFESYPRDIAADLELLSAEGVDLVFTPSVDEMYGRGAETTVEPGPLSLRWEGEIRPGHFTGVATVVAKLFNIVRPDLAFFGEKDYQQLRIVSRMTDDLDLGLGIVGCPIVRDASGLALSSRNAYLTPEQKAAALALPEALEAAAAALAWGERDARALEAIMAETIDNVGRDVVSLEYAAVVEPSSLEPAEVITGTARALIAARVGSTRLIDNCALVAPAATTT